MINEQESWRDKFSEGESEGRRDGYRPQGYNNDRQGYGRPMRPRINREGNGYNREGGYQPVHATIRKAAISLAKAVISLVHVTIAKAVISLAKVISREKEAIALAITEKKAAISLVHDTTAKAVISKEKAVISSVRAATIVVHVLLATILMQSTA